MPEPILGTVDESVLPATKLLTTYASGTNETALNGRCAPVRFPQLDGLRCLAVVMVMWDHAGPSQYVHSFGDDGVRLFFVLSGYLITGILLRLRDSGIRFGQALRIFFARRLLRLLPVY